MRKVPTFTAHIYVGTRTRYSGEVYGVQMAREWLHKHVNKDPLCVTLTETEFIYTDGGEPGLVIGLIDYPRFPSQHEAIKERARRIALAMLRMYQQGKVSIVFSDETEMYEAEEL